VEEYDHRPDNTDQVLRQHLEIARRNAPQLVVGLTAYARDLPRGPLKDETLRLAKVLGDLTNDAERPSATSFDATLLPLVDPRVATDGVGPLLRGLVETYGVTDDVRRRVIATLAYPTVVVLIGIALLTLFSFFVAPPFQDLFADFGTELPAAKKLVLTFAEFVRDYFYVYLLVSLTFVAACWWVGHLVARRRFVEYIPLLGRSVREYRLGRLMARAARLLDAGVPPGTSLRVAARELPRGRLQRRCLLLGEQIEESAQSQVLPDAHELPRMLQQILQQSMGNDVRAKMLRRLSAVYLQRSRSRMTWWISALEPIAIVTVGCLVGFGVTTLMLPIVSLINNLSS
jgi:type IV pilus assembly protein PilC